MTHEFSGYRVFFKEFRRRFDTTGSIVPSSRFLANALARYVREGKHRAADKPRTVLEVGPGTGSVTDKIVTGLGPADRLDLVELNNEFVSLLRHRFQSEAELRRVADRVRILHQPVEELAGEDLYDLMVSGLPLNNFAAAEVEQILNVFARLLRPGGRLSFFEYAAIRKLRSLVSSKADRERLRGVGEALRQVLRRGEIRREFVWLNLPPAWVHHVEF